MKRDMDLVRQLLLKIESYDDSIVPHCYQREKHEEWNELWHVAILMEGGYVSGEIQKDDYGGIVFARPRYLTWKGCELLDTIRDSNVWSRTKSNLSGKIASVSLAVLTEVATGAAKSMLGLC